MKIPHSLFVNEQLAAGLGTGTNAETRTLYIVGEITDEVVYRFIVAFRLFDQTPGPIHVLMMSTGGSEPGGYVIHDSIALSPNEVTIDCYGVCMSIAALILQSGTRRRLAPECRFMIHNGHVDLTAGVPATTLVAFGEEIGRNNLRYQSILAKRSGLEIEHITRLCEKETYLSAAQAIALGFADEIIAKLPSAKLAPRKKR